MLRKILVSVAVLAFMAGGVLVMSGCAHDHGHEDHHGEHPTEHPSGSEHPTEHPSGSEHPG